MDVKLENQVYGLSTMSYPSSEWGLEREGPGGIWGGKRAANTATLTSRCGGHVSLEHLSPIPFTLFQAAIPVVIHFWSETVAPFPSLERPMQQPVVTLQGCLV